MRVLPPVTLLAVLLLLLPVCFSYRVVGRHRRNADGSVSFDMPGVWVEARIAAADAAGRVHGAFSQAGDAGANNGWKPNYFLSWCDGVPQPGGLYNATFNSSGWSSAPSGIAVVPVCSGLDPHAGTSVVIFKSTEAQWNSLLPTPNFVTFHGFQEPEVAAPAPAPRRKRIEFLGDSITAGFCNLCFDNGGIPNTVATESYAHSWANLICQHFDADCQTAAWSGYGMVQNCVSLIFPHQLYCTVCIHSNHLLLFQCGGATLMSDVWRRILASVPSEDPKDPHGTTAANAYDFAFAPDALVINLGTNDGLSRRPQNIADFNATYLDLTLSAAQAYDNVTFFLACGPMDEAYCGPVQWVIAELTARGKPAHFLDQRGILKPPGAACCGHPSAVTDINMAAAGSAFIAKAMGWRV